MSNVVVSSKSLDSVDVNSRAELIYLVDLGAEGQLLTPGFSGSFLAAPIPLIRRTISAVTAYGKSVRLVGFRTYLWPDDTYTTDEVYDDVASPLRFVQKLRSGQAENLEWIEEGDKLRLHLEGSAEVIEEPVVSLASDEPSNYGSWIYRIIPKLMANVPSDVKYLAYVNSPWMKEMLELFGVSPARIVAHWPKRHYVLNEAYIPNLRNQDVYIDAHSCRMYRDVAERLGERKFYEKVYFSRIGQSTRKLLNEEALQDALVSQGFSIIQPELLPLAEQIRLARDARVIVCPGGSGLFNCVFANNAEFVLDMEPGTEWVYAHHNLLRSTGKRHSILFGSRADNVEPHGPWNIDVDLVVEALRYHS